MYAQSHAVLYWTQEYNQEEGLYTKINECAAILCLTQGCRDPF